MDRAQIDRAVVYHSWGKEHDPVSGNTQLMEIVSENPRFLPSWVILPPATNEMDPLETLIGDVLEGGVATVRLFPNHHSYSLSEWCSGSLLGALESHRIPVMIDLSETSFEALQGVCENHPRLPVILSDVSYRTDRNIYPLLKRYTNLRIETSFYQVHRGIESVSREFGASRLIFGSGHPDLQCGPMAMTIRYAKIPDSDKKAILGGNLERLMEGIRR